MLGNMRSPVSSFKTQPLRDGCRACWLGPPCKESGGSSGGALRPHLFLSLALAMGVVYVSQLTGDLKNSQSRDPGGIHFNEMFIIRVLLLYEGAAG